MRPWLLALFTAAAGCGEALPLHVVDGAAPTGGMVDAETVALLEEGAGLLGLTIELVDDKRGAVVIELVDVKSEENEGRQYLRQRCRRIVRAERGPVTIAHELGHALYLDHIDDDPENIMSPTIDRETSVWLEDWQLDTVREEVVDLRACLDW